VSEVLVLQVPSLWDQSCIEELQEAVEQTCDCDSLVISEDIDTLSKGELTVMLENTIDALQENDN
jgi:redox-regulated HSP33 family molecular chaperone